MNIDVYIKERVNDQINWYSGKTSRFKKYHNYINIFCLLVTSGTSLTIILQLLYENLSNGILILISILTIIATVLLAVDKLYKFEELRINYRSTCEKLIQEKYVFLTVSGEYFNLAEKDRNNLFVQRCESIMTTEVGNWSQLNEKKQL